MKYNVGDKVRIVSEWPYKARINGNGLMDHWRGKIMTIRSIEDVYYRMIEDIDERRDCNGWYWYEDLIEGLAEESLTEIDISDFRELYRELI